MATSSPSGAGSGYLGFNLAPGPSAGSGAYGATPGLTSAPPSIFQQVGANVPGSAGLAQGSATNIASQQAGMLSPGTSNLLRDNAAAMGVTAGQPGGLPGNTISNANLLTDMGLTSEGLTQQGDQNYLSFLGGVGGAQLNPSLLTDISQSNANLAAAPDPAAAQAAQQARLMQMYTLGLGPSKPGNPNWWQNTANSGQAFTPPGGTEPNGTRVPLTF